MLAMKIVSEETEVRLSRHGGGYSARQEPYDASIYSLEGLLTAFSTMCASDFLVDHAISSIFLVRAVPMDASHMTLHLHR